MRRSTLAVTGGRGSPAPGEPLNPPAVFTSAYRAGGTDHYARDGNPTWEALEHAVGALDGGEAVAFSSGMGAAAAILESLRAEATVVIASSAYAEVRRLLANREAAGKLTVRVVDAADTSAVAEALGGAHMLWLDTPTNPHLDVCELDVIAANARRAGAEVVVDATLATPMLQRPLSQGADIVLHSASKYIGGHSDLLLGIAVTADPERAHTLRRTRTAVGSVPGTMEAFLALRGLRTLPLRIERGQQSAAELAARLVSDSRVKRIRYPGLPGDPSREAATRLMDGYGAMIAFEVRGGPGSAQQLCEAVELITHATSLGGVETLIETCRHHSNEGDELPDGLVRVSVGCEDVEDLWRDIDRALAAIQASPTAPDTAQVDRAAGDAAEFSPA